MKVQSLPNVPFRSVANATSSIADENEIQDLPEIVKNSIKSREQVFTILDFTNKVKYGDYYNLGEFKSYLEGVLSRCDVIEEVIFNGIEAVTDAVFYVLYKYFSSCTRTWSKLKSLSMQSCRYITDFGLELFSLAVGQNASSLLDVNRLHGCSRLLTHLHLPFSKDIFDSESFNGTYLDKNKLEHNLFKVTIINESALNLIHFIKTKEVSNQKAPIINYGQINLPNNYIFKMFEIDTVWFKFFE